MVVRIRRPSKGALFIPPFDPAPRTAILAPGFRQTRLVRIFPQGWDEKAKRFNPACIAGRLEKLLAVAHDGWPVELAVVVFTSAGGEELTQSVRESLWDAFGVPVFEQYLNAKNRLLATECDAHSGLHVVSGCEEFRLEAEVCACGNAAPRLARGRRIDELAGLLA
jgi:hypothetical protein